LKHKHTTLIHSGEETDKAIHALALKNGYSVDVELTKENPDWEESDHVKVYDNQSLVERNRGMVDDSEVQIFLPFKIDASEDSPIWKTIRYAIIRQKETKSTVYIIDKFGSIWGVWK
jgi:hypothetical protein